MSTDRLIFLQKWKAGEQIDLQQILSSDKAFRVGANNQAREAAG